MKMIIVEGHDNSGKSTLAAHLGKVFHMPVHESEGPPRSPEEINMRCMKYELWAEKEPSIFVRHPVISNAIYARFRAEGDPITEENRQRLYANTDVLIIYADQGTRGLGGHNVKDHDTADHLRLLEQNASALLSFYRIWAIEKAQLMYRIGDGYDFIERAVAAFLAPTQLQINTEEWPEEQRERFIEALKEIPSTGLAQLPSFEVLDTRPTGPNGKYGKPRG